MDCVEKGIPINEDSKLEVEGTKVISTHTINYTVTNGDDGITKTMSICDHSLDEWGGNVILM